MSVVGWSLDTSRDRSFSLIQQFFLAAILVGASLLTISTPYAHIFDGGYTNFQTHDSWYHVRLIEYAARNFPHVLHVDPYLLRNGDTVPTGPLFDWANAGVIRMVCGDDPVSPCAERVMAYASPIAGLLTMAIVFGIGRRVFGTSAGLAAAALLATMPSLFEDLTLLGVADHHSFEALFSSLTLFGIVVSLNPWREQPRRAAAAAAGCALGAYLLVWTSGSFLVAMLALWAGAQLVLDRTDEGFAKVARLLAIALVVAALIVLLFEDAGTPKRDLQLAALAASIVGLAALEGVRRLGRHLAWRRWLIVTAPVAVVFIAAAAATMAAPAVAQHARNVLGRMLPNANAVAMEAQPLSAQEGGVWGGLDWMFHSGIVVAIPGALFVLVRLRRGRPEHVLVAVWAAFMFLATFGQIRFGVYLAVPVALLGGWSIAFAGRLIGRLRHQAIVAMALTVAICYPNIASARVNGEFNWGLPPAWREALRWMRGATPDPFGDPDHYFARDPGARPAGYTVMDWWQHGYWIIREARRVPVANPTQAGAEVAARFYTATDPAAAHDELRSAGARYIVVGDEVPLHFDNTGGVWSDWFGNMLQWTAAPMSRYCEILPERMPNGSLVSAVMFYPEYFEAMADRLYLFGGAAVTPHDSSWVVTMVQEREPDGTLARVATDVRRFATSEDARAEVRRRGAGDHRIVSLDPTQSPVPLAAVDYVRVAHDSPEPSFAFAGRPVARIFEVTK